MTRAVVLGAVLVAAGFAAAIAIAVPSFLNVKDRIESFPKTRLSEGAVELESRDYDVYLDVPAETPESGWTLSIRDPRGREVMLRRTSSEITYDWSGRTGARIGRVAVSAPGRHVVRGTGPPGADVVFADDVVGGIGRSLLLALGALGVLGSAGVVTIIVAATRRRPREPKRWP